MDANYVHLEWWQLAAASTLIGFNVLFSLILKLRLEQQLFIAALRMVCQLLLVGLILEWVFTLNNFLWILGVALIMVTMAAFSAVNRTKRRYRNIYWNSLIAILGSAFLVTGFGLKGVIQIEPWFHPQYLFPLLGMVLGNTLTGISLALERFMEDLSLRQNEIEGLLALGATRWEAAHQGITEAIRAGMIPTINSMMVMGIVSLPGMMTGQILAGANPLDAIRYQIVIIFMIAAASAMGVISITLLAYFSLFNKQHQLCVDRLVLKKK